MSYLLKKFVYKVIQEFMAVMLKMWADELNSRDDDIKMSVKGKIEAGVYAQTRQEMCDF